jgi:hypothetical protein
MSGTLFFGFHSMNFTLKNMFSSVHFPGPERRGEHVEPPHGGLNAIFDASCSFDSCRSWCRLPHLPLQRRPLYAAFLMDSIVHTGSTRTAGGVSLVSLSFASPQKEEVCLLLHLPTSEHNARTLQEECASIVQQSLLGGEGDPWQRLDGTLKELNGLFKGLMLSKSIDEIHAVVALLDASRMLHVSHAGRGEAYLVRDGTASQITEFSKGKPLSAFVHISSGQMEPGDAVVFSTQRLLRTFTPAQITQLSHREAFLEEVIDALESDKEIAAVATMMLPGGADEEEEEREERPRARGALPPRRVGRRRQGFQIPTMDDLKAGLSRLAPIGAFLGRTGKSLGQAGARLGKGGVSAGKKSAPKLMHMPSRIGDAVAVVQEKAATFVADLRHPERKRRAHLLLLAGAVAVFLLIWAIVSLSTISQRSKTRAELNQQIQQINEELQTADNRKLAGDAAAADTILEHAEGQAKEIVQNRSALFQSEALDLLDRIRQKRDELNNVATVAPRVLVNLTEKNPSVAAQGLIGLGDGEFVAYDRQFAYQVILDKAGEPRKLVDEELILQGADFPRQKSQVYLTTGNSLIEANGSQLTTMKTDDPAGWVTGKALETYLRFLYILAPDKKQIYKYERLNNHYGPATPYNVNGDLTNAVDIAVDGSVYALKSDGTVLKLLRGESQPFSIHGAPDGVLKGATKMFKIPDGNFYFLDPVKNRVVVIGDGGQTGESSYVKQFLLKSDQIGTLQDLYVDPDQNHLYLVDEKRMYVVDLK